VYKSYENRKKVKCIFSRCRQYLSTYHIPASLFKLLVDEDLIDYWKFALATTQGCSVHVSQKGTNLRELKTAKMGVELTNRLSRRTRDEYCICGGYLKISRGAGCVSDWSIKG
jgi:hypothetical protein